MNVCRTTGLTVEQQERWPFLYSHLSSEIEIPSLMIWMSNSSLRWTKRFQEYSSMSEMVKPKVENHLLAT